MLHSISQAGLFVMRTDSGMRHDIRSMFNVQCIGGYNFLRVDFKLDDRIALPFLSLSSLTSLLIHSSIPVHVTTVLKQTEAHAHNHIGWQNGDMQGTCSPDHNVLLPWTSTRSETIPFCSHCSGSISSRKLSKLRSTSIAYQ